jgi:hypothetical protein
VHDLVGEDGERLRGAALVLRASGRQAGEVERRSVIDDRPQAVAGRGAELGLVGRHAVGVKPHRALVDLIHHAPPDRSGATDLDGAVGHHAGDRSGAVLDLQPLAAHVHPRHAGHGEHERADGQRAWGRQA